MYYDSDDETVSGDEDVNEEASASGTLRRRTQTLAKKVITRDRSSGGRKGFVTDTINAVQKKRRSGSYSYKGFHLHPVIVVDYDLTLVNRMSRPFPGSHEFIEKLRDVNDGHNELILYSHGSPAYIDDGLTRHYEHERKLFDEIISDSSARDNKPITYVRKVIKRLDHLIGPYVIIDDMRSNLDGDQYDIVIDVTRMTEYDVKGSAVSVDYNTCLRTIDKGIREFLNTKKKS